MPTQSIFHQLEQIEVKEAPNLGLYGRCGRTVQPRLVMCFMVFELVWDLASLHYKRKVVLFSDPTLEVQALNLVRVTV